MLITAALPYANGMIVGGKNSPFGNAVQRTPHLDFAPRIGIAYDPFGDGKTSVRASYGRAYEFVNAQFHLNTSVAPPWGSEVRLNAPPGGLDNPFLGSPGGQTNIFPVTFDKNAPFSLNGPFLSLTNDLDATNVQLFNATVERQVAARWFATARAGSAGIPWPRISSLVTCRQLSMSPRSQAARSRGPALA